MNISKEQINNIVKLKREASKMKEEAENLEEQLHKEANDLLLEVSKYEKIEHLDLFSFDHIDEDYIYYEGRIYTGRDYHNQDTYDYIEHELPVEILYDETARKKYFEELSVEAKEIADKEAAKIEAIRLDKEVKEKAKYLELKSKYENAGE